MENKNKQKPNIELVKADERQVVIKGKKLRVEWLDSFILIYSKEEHKYRGN